jgi:hypothetical protein
MSTGKATGLRTLSDDEIYPLERAAATVIGVRFTPPPYFRSHAPSRRISLLFPPGNSAVSEALKTT